MKSAESGSTTVPTKLVTGGADAHFLPHLCAAIHRASAIEMAVAFIQPTGLKLLLPDLQAAIERWRLAQPDLAKVPLRILTSDYLDITDTQALRQLMLLQAQGADIRVYETAGHSFHLKAYLFIHSAAGEPLQGQAFIGSSNISKTALTDGLEWNYRIDHPGDAGFIEARQRFADLFDHPQSRPLSDAWIDAYAARRKVQPHALVLVAQQEQEPPPLPSPLQQEALQALQSARAAQAKRGLVVLATGLGKTWLAAFDAEQFAARRVLFVAHREEILQKAAETFLRIRPNQRVGFYMGQQRDQQVDVLCASVQTLGRETHLQRFAPQHFDYIVIDEFHHAAAATYQRLLNYFAPSFLLGLTATPDRTDQSDILSLCDDNLVYSCHLFRGIEMQLLVPFHYFGVFDACVDYAEIPWRNGRFEVELLVNKLATLNRARHALREWRARAQSRTLAFCISKRHADFMAQFFREQGVQAAAVYSDSELSRGEALEQLADGRLQVLFSVDLFNEGTDLPSIDTVMMLRPTESKVLFLQQLGRGLRLSPATGKQRLVVIDFIGNHHSFLHKPQALAGSSMSYRQLAEFVDKAAKQQLSLPDGCFINYDLQLIDFLKQLSSDGLDKDYQSLRDTLGRRPTLTEFYRFGVSLSQLRQQFGDWFALVLQMGDGTSAEQALYPTRKALLRLLESGKLPNDWHWLTLEAAQELEAWQQAPSLAQLAERSWSILQHKPVLLAQLPAELRAVQPNADWQQFWRANAVDGWLASGLFGLDGEDWLLSQPVSAAQAPVLAAWVRELLDYRWALLAAKASTAGQPANQQGAGLGTPLAYFPTLQIACGHFRSSRADDCETRWLPARYGQLDPARHFIARAVGNSMNGGKHPIHDGDYLLLEQLDAAKAGGITGSVLAIERQDAGGDNQYLLRVVLKEPDGSYVLRANNPDYADLPVTEELRAQLRTFARLKAVLDPLELAVGQSFMREEIAPLFGAEFNTGSWNVGHVFLAEAKAHVLLVTLNKEGKVDEHRYVDHWEDEHTFHWQTQNSTSPSNKRGRELIEHAQRGLSIHLFIRERRKLANGTAAPFVYYGAVRYLSHSGSQPMSVRLQRV